MGFGREVIKETSNCQFKSQRHLRAIQLRPGKPSVAVHACGPSPEVVEAVGLLLSLRSSRTI